MHLRARVESKNKRSDRWGLSAMPKLKKHLSEFPELLAQWNPTKNGDKKPEHFTSGSNEEIWWLCSEVDDHEWQVRIHSRTGKGSTGCPHCHEIQRKFS